MSCGKALDRLVNERRAHEAPNRSRATRGDRCGRATPSCGVDVPARAPLEPRPLRRRELPRVARALEARLHEDLRAVLRQLEIEARAERLVAEAELHHLRLDDDAAPLEEREQIARVLAAHFDPDAARALRSRSARGGGWRRGRPWASDSASRGARSGRSGVRAFGSSSVTVSEPPGPCPRVAPGAGTRSSSASAASARGATRPRPSRRTPEHPLHEGPRPRSVPPQLQCSRRAPPPPTTPTARTFQIHR